MKGLGQQEGRIWSTVYLNVQTFKHCFGGMTITREGTVHEAGAGNTKIVGTGFT